jgi:hypothetical protein
VGEEGRDELGDEVEEARLRVDAVGAVDEEVAEYVERTFGGVERVYNWQQLEGLPPLLCP